MVLVTVSVKQVLVQLSGAEKRSWKTYAGVLLEAKAGVGLWGLELRLRLRHVRVQ